MKRRILSIAVAAAMALTLIPPVEAKAASKGGVPNEFMVPVSQPLVESRTEGLYDEPEIPLPDTGESGFIVPVEGGAPKMPAAGLMAEVPEAAEGVKISTAEELSAIAGAGTYVLTADIDLTGKNWAPLNAAKGPVILDGQGHTIKGLTINAVSEGEWGLFGSVNGGLTIKNLRLEAAEIRLDVVDEKPAVGSTYGIGALAGRVSGELTLQNVTADEVTINRVGVNFHTVGGLVGRATGAAHIRDTAVRVKMPDQDVVGVQGSYVGGILGSGSSGAAFERCYVDAEMDVSNTAVVGVGGLAGYLPGSGKEYHFKDCAAKVRLDAGANRAGGLAMECSGLMRADNCVVEGDLTGGMLGGFAARSGIAAGSGGLIAANCRFSGSLHLRPGKETWAGGFVGHGYARNSLTACAADVTLSSETNEGTMYLGGLLGQSKNGYNILSCAADVTVKAFSGKVLHLGGAVGDSIGSGNTIKDTLVEFYTDELVGTGACNLGGMIGYSQNVTAENCGVNAQINYTQAVQAGIRLGGFAGNLGKTNQLFRCWSGGSVNLAYNNVTNTGTSSIGYGLGGLLGYGATVSMGQCYGGAEVRHSYGPGGRSAGEAGALAGGLSNATIYSCWSDADIDFESTKATQVGYTGGLVGETGTCSFRDCTYTGTISGSDVGDLGGLLGTTSSGSFRNCYVIGDLSGGDDTGGILGDAGHEITMEDCFFEGSCTARTMASGLSGGASAYKVVTMRRCRVYGSMSAPGGRACGLCAGNGAAYECSFIGDLSGAYMAGISYGGNVYDSTASVSVESDLNGGDELFVGGIACAPGLVDHCQVTNHIYLDARAEENRNSLTIRAGGISAYGGTVVDSTTRGIAVCGTGNDENRISAQVGGLVGASIRAADNCRVEGSISADVHQGGIHVGGVSGSGIERGVISGCTVRGSVSGRLKDLAVYAGGILGAGTKTTKLNSCYHAGSVSAFSQEASWVYTKHPLVGNDLFESGGTVNVPQRPDEVFTIQTYYYKDDLSSSLIAPLGDVEITVNGSVIGKTDASGVLTITKEQAGSLALTIKGTKEGYFDGESFATLSDGGYTNLYLMEKTDGKIYLTAAQFLQENSRTLTYDMVDVLYGKNEVRVLQTDGSYRQSYFGVDWNDTEEEGRTLYLAKKDGTQVLELAANTDNWICLRDHFEPGEEVYLVAEARYGDGTVTQNAKLGLEVISVKPVLPVAGGAAEIGGRDGVHLFDGAEIKVKIDDLVKAGKGSVKYKNGTLTVEFGLDDSKEGVKLLFDEEVKLSVKGKVQIPFTEEANGEWSGKVETAFNRELESDSEKNNEGVKRPEGEKLLSWEALVNYGPVPVKFIITFDVGAVAELGFSGDYEDADIEGKLSGDGTAEVKARLGGDVTKELKFYVEGGGEMKLELNVEFRGLIGTPAFKPALSGKVFANVTAKAGELIDAKWEKDLGSFKWNPEDGVKWYALGTEVDWLMDQRAYLASGGGFDGGAVSALDWKDAPVSGADHRLVYENIQRSSVSALGVENGVSVLYFTADDGSGGSEGRVADHTALWRSERQSDGSWGTPAVISEGGYPDEVAVNDGYAVWVESDETDSMDGLLRSTDLKIACGGEIIHTIDGGGFIYAPAVSADAGGNILAAWLSDEAVTGETLLSAESQVLRYARYDAAAGVWTTGTVETDETPVTVTLAPGNTGTIYYSDAAGNLKRCTGTTFGNTADYLNGLKHFVTAGDGSVSMNDDGVLTVYWQQETVAEFETGHPFAGELVLLQEDGVWYVLWEANDGVYYADSTDNMTSIKKAAEETAGVEKLSAVIEDGRPLVSYYRTDDTAGEEQKHLISAWAEDLSGTDLVLRDVEMDSRDLDETGILRIHGTVGNRMKTEQAGYGYRVTDESGAIAAEGSVETALGFREEAQFSIPVGHDVTAHKTYTLEVFPLSGEDANGENNAVTLEAEAEGAIASTGFMTTPEGTGMEVLVKNIGAAPAEDLHLEIVRANLEGEAVGKVLVSEDLGTLNAGAYRQTVLEKVKANTYYLVTLWEGGTLLESELLMQRDESVSGAWFVDARVDEDGKAKAEVQAQNWTKDVYVFLAVYDETGRMVTSGMERFGPWEGSKRLEADLSAALESGSYTYSGFLLEQGTLIPAAEVLSGTVDIR